MLRLEKPPIEFHFCDFFSNNISRNLPGLAPNLLPNFGCAANAHRSVQGHTLIPNHAVPFMWWIPH